MSLRDDIICEIDKGCSLDCLLKNIETKEDGDIAAEVEAMLKEEILVKCPDGELKVVAWCGDSLKYLPSKQEEQTFKIIREFGSSKSEVTSQIYFGKSQAEKALEGIDKFLEAKYGASKNKLKISIEHSDLDRNSWEVEVYDLGENDFNCLDWIENNADVFPHCDFSILFVRNINKNYKKYLNNVFQDLDIDFEKFSEHICFVSSDYDHDCEIVISRIKEYLDQPFLLEDYDPKKNHFQTRKAGKRNDTIYIDDVWGYKDKDLCAGR